MSGGIGDGPGPAGGIYEALKGGRIQGEKARLKAAASLLESSFYQELFKAMRDTVPDSGLLDGGGGQDMFTSMLDQHVADTAASRAQRGLTRALYRQLAGVLGGEDASGGAGETAATGAEPGAPAAEGDS